MKLHSRIFTLLFIILLGLATSSLTFLYQSSKNKVEYDVGVKLGIAQTAFYDVLDNQQKWLSASVETVVKDWGLRQSIGQRDEATLRGVLYNHSARVGADVALFVDTNSSFSVSTLSENEKLSEYVTELVASSREASLYRIAVFNGRYYQLVLNEVRAPVRIGWLGMGFVIDDSIAKRYSGITGVDISFVEQEAAGLRFVGSSLSPKKTEELGAVRPMMSTKPWLLSGTEWQDLALYRKFSERDGSKLGVLLQDSLDRPRQRFNQWWLSLSSIFALISVLALGFGYVISRNISKPLQQLVDAADDISQGNYSNKIELERNDEIGLLSQAFTKMQLAVSEREEEITFQAGHDGLTGLLNRLGLISCLDEKLSVFRRSEDIIAVANFRLNHFQQIVDALGYSWGDTLLSLVTLRLKSEFGEESLARINLEEFVLISEVNDLASVNNVQQRIRKAFSTAFNVSGIELHIKISMGIAMYPFSGDSAVGLLRRAGVALNEADEAQAETVVYDPKHDENSLRHLTLMTELPKAISEDQVCLHFQPKLSRSDTLNQIESVECLVRWNHPELGFVPPDDFIELAEKTGYVVELTRWVLRTAIKQAVEWSSGGWDLAVAVNISALDLQQAGFDQTVAALLQEYSLPASRLTLEVTESAAVANPVSAIKQLSNLRKLGVKLSVDDYGTGYSSLAQLKQLPVHELKVDKSFVLDLLGSEEDQVIVRSTIELAHNMELSVVAEGVEDEATLNQLLEWRCDSIQGYFIARPMGAAKLSEWLKAGQYPVRKHT